mgnify:CR=1 FL=1
MSEHEALRALAATIITVLAPAAPYLKSALDKFTEKAVDAAWQTARGLYDKVRQRFETDHNDNAQQTLDLFVADPETFEAVLSKYLLQTLQTHPEWAAEIRALLAQPATQEIIARNKSTLERVTQSMTGAGTQRIEADHSKLKDVKQDIR